MKLNTTLTNIVSKMLRLRIFRNFAYRTGRFIYHSARGEIRNTMDSNGEIMLQKCIINYCRQEKSSILAFDIGANIGEWSSNLLREASRNGIQASIHGFEPVPETYDRLTVNLNKAMNQGSFIPHQIAASDQDGCITMHSIGPCEGRNSIYSPSSQEATTAIKINCFKLDTFVAENNFQIIHIIKCDTEGHDASVIKGASNSLQSGVIKIMQFEYNHRWIDARQFLRDVFDTIANTPYAMGRLMQDRIECYERWHPEMEKYIEGNYVLIHKDLIPWIPRSVGHYTLSNAFVIPRKSSGK